MPLLIFIARWHQCRLMRGRFLDGFSTALHREFHRAPHFMVAAPFAMSFWLLSRAKLIFAGILAISFTPLPPRRYADDSDMFNRWGCRHLRQSPPPVYAKAPKMTVSAGRALTCSCLSTTHYICSISTYRVGCTDASAGPAEQYFDVGSRR